MDITIVIYFKPYVLPHGRMVYEEKENKEKIFVFFLKKYSLLFFFSNLSYLLKAKEFFFLCVEKKKVVRILKYKRKRKRVQAFSKTNKKMKTHWNDSVSLFQLNIRAFFFRVVFLHLFCFWGTFHLFFFNLQEKNIFKGINVK